MPIVCTSEDEFRDALINGAILYFPCPQRLHTLVPHYFVVVTFGHPHYYFCCSTSNLGTVEELIRKNKYSQETFVWVDPNDDENPFNLDSYLNCNEYFHFSFQELWEIHEEGAMVVYQPIPDVAYHQIINGYNSSLTIEDDFKDMLPGLD